MPAGVRYCDSASPTVVPVELELLVGLKVYKHKPSTAIWRTQARSSNVQAKLRVKPRLQRQLEREAGKKPRDTLTRSAEQSAFISLSSQDQIQSPTLPRRIVPKPVTDGQKPLAS